MKIVIPITPAEHAEIKRRAGLVPVATWLRARALEGSDVPPRSVGQWRRPKIPPRAKTVPKVMQRMERNLVADILSALPPPPEPPTRASVAVMPLPPPPQPEYRRATHDEPQPEAYATRDQARFERALEVAAELAGELAKPAAPAPMTLVLDPPHADLAADVARYELAEVGQ